MQNTRRRKKLRSIDIPSPRAIKAALDQHIIGQEQAKTTLAVAIVNHLKRVHADAVTPDDDPYAQVELDKSNVLLIGPTGVGKTLLARTLARRIEVPFATGDATTLTEAGYVGDDVEVLVQRLLVNSNQKVEEAQRGIIFLDEIDKIRSNQGIAVGHRDVSGAGVQHALLKLIEGTTATITCPATKKNPQAQVVQVDTRNILFICGGTFDGLEDIVARRKGKRRIGFGAEQHEDDAKRKTDLLREVTPEDLNEFGMIPEFTGRLPVIAVLQDLDERDLERVLVEPRNALLKQFERLFHLEGQRVKFDDSAIKEFARRAVALGTNARALRQVVEQVMTPLMFRLSDFDPGCLYVVDAETVRGGLPKKVPVEQVAQMQARRQIG